MVLSEIMKGKILALNSQNLSNRAISHEIGCDESTVRRFLKKFRETNSVSRTPGSGRPRATTLREDRLVPRIQLRDRFKTAREVKRELLE